MDQKPFFKEDIPKDYKKAMQQNAIAYGSRRFAGAHGMVSNYLTQRCKETTT